MPIPVERQRSLVAHTSSEVVDLGSARIRTVMRRWGQPTGRLSGSLVQEDMKHISKGMPSLAYIPDTSGAIESREPAPRSGPLIGRERLGPTPKGQLGRPARVPSNIKQEYVEGGFAPDTKG